MAEPGPGRPSLAQDGHMEEAGVIISFRPQFPPPRNEGAG